MKYFCVREGQLYSWQVLEIVHKIDEEIVTKMSEYFKHSNNTIFDYISLTFWSYFVTFLALS